MSEIEIKKRQDYKRNRKKWITIQIAAIVVVCVIVLSSFLVYDRMNRTYYIEYTESSNVNYAVHYTDNDFFEDEWIGSGQSYVTSLIDNMGADFRYVLNMDSNNIAFDYTYSIKAQLIVSDKITGDHIFDPTEVLLPENKITARNTDSISVSEHVNIDFVKYNTKATQFIDVYGLKDATAMLVVTLDVNVLSSCEEFENNNQNRYSASLNIPLCEENFSIYSSNSLPTGESKVLACKGAVNQDIFFIIGVIFAVIGILLGCVLAIFVYVTRNDDINYAIKVKKILSAYRSFIQQIDGEFDASGYQLVPIKSFNEMLGIRDTIQSPVLMSENKDETMTRFLIPTATKLLYVFEIKVDNYDEIYGLNEHHGVVLEFEDEEGIEEAIIIEENVNMDDLAEAMATPDVVLDQIDFVQDDDVDYEGTEEHPGIEVVGVVWPEKKKNNKVYHYDPNGEQLSEGDMVLVPTRDAAKDREVIRKAAIAHGNHTIDPESHPHILKRIIGVIKRRAEAALTPNITEETGKDENQ